MKMIIFAHGGDVPGIGAALTKVLFEKNCSIDNFKMITLEGFFSLSMTVLCEVYEDHLEVEGLLKESVKDFKVMINVYPLNGQNIQEALKQEWIPYRVSMICGDQTAVLCYFMKEMSYLRINVSNICCHRTGQDTEDNTFQLLVTVQIPVSVSFDYLKSSLEEIGRKLNTLIDINPVEGLED